MKFSRYNLSLPQYPFKDSTLIYNTLTKASVVLSKELKDLIGPPAGSLCHQKSLVEEECGVGRDDPSGRLYGGSDPLSKEDREYLQELKELGIIVEDEIDEGLQLNYWYNKLRFSTVVWNGVIIPTTDCDLGCVYCYQEGAKTTFYMKREVQEMTVKWFEEKIEKDRPKQVFWVFFGGEPLLDIPAVDFMTSSLKKYCDEKRVIFQFSIITNGTNLSEERVKFWNEQGLVSIQVTLDGYEEIHNQRRPFIGGGKSFSKIFNNILGIVDKTDVILRLNIDAHNLKETPKFLDFLKEHKLEDKLTIFYGLLLEADKPLPHQKKYRIVGEEGAQGILSLRQSAIERGFKVSEILEGGPCIAKSECSVMIDPRGKIYKCTGHVGLEEFALGGLGDWQSLSRCRTDLGEEEFAVGEVGSSSKEYEQKYAQYVGMQLDEECLNCVFAPICLGGCPYKSYTKFGDPKKKVCEKSYYQTLAKDVLKQMFTEEEIKEKMRK